MLRIIKFLHQNSPRMFPHKFFLHILNSLRIYLFLGRFLRDGHWYIVSTQRNRGNFFFTFPNPFHQWIIDEDITEVDYYVLIVLHCWKSVDHRLLKNSLVADGFHDLRKAFGQSERNKLWNCEVSARAKAVSKINQNDWSRWSMNQKVLQMSIPYAQYVSNNASNGIIW